MPSLLRFATVIRRLVWGMDMSTMSPLRARLLHIIRGVYMLARDLSQGQLTLYATSLVYTTLLSLVPLLAVSFSVLKAFGVHNKMQPVLLQFLLPLGTKGVEITVQILTFVENIKVGVLGALGLGMLIYTVVSLLQKIEQAFNFTWHVRQSRPLIQRFSQYLSVLTIGPVLVFAAVGITATLMNHEFTQSLIAAMPFGGALKVLSGLVPYLLISMAFTFLYVLVPNTRVNLTSALFGGVIAGVLWQLSGLAFASFVVTSTKYTAVYSGFAIVIMFMIWLYLSWLILLLGASISYYHQHPEHLTVRRHSMRLSNRVKERLALQIVSLIIHAYYRNEETWSTDRLACHLKIPVEMVARLIDALEQHGLLAQTGDKTPQIVPARPLESTTVKEFLDVVRSAEERHHLSASQLPANAQVDQLMADLDRAMGEAMHDLSLKDLALDALDKDRATPR